RDEEAQIDRDRLLESEQMDGLFLDLDLRPVDRFVVGDPHGRLRGGGFRKRLHRAGDLLFHLGAEEDQAAAQVLELLGEMLLHAADPFDATARRTGTSSALKTGLRPKTRKNSFPLRRALSSSG